MKIFFKFLGFVMLFSYNLLGQVNLAPSPNPETGEYDFYYYDSTAAIKSVHLAGTLNGWNQSSLPYKKLDNNLWKLSTKLYPGVRIYYKLIIDGKRWIPDPNAPYITQDQWRNSVVNAIRTDEFGLLSSYPIEEGTIVRPEKLFLYYFDPSKTLENKIIQITLNNEVKTNFIVDTKNKRIEIPVRPELQGHCTLTFDVRSEKIKFSKTVHFFSQAEPAKIKTPEKNNTSIVYEVYVRQFSDGNADGIGDLLGLTNKLDYIRELGANILWLMPIHQSPTDHGYGISDYYKINDQYGGDSAFHHFIHTAHEKGLKVWMDFVINHSDSTLPFFLDVVKNGKQSRYWNWYQITNEKPLKYNHFGGNRQMPKFNFDNEEVVDFFIKNALHWLDPNNDGDLTDGVDGFRCDAALEVPHSFWKKLREKVKQVNPEFTLLGEIWADHLTILPFYDHEFDMVFDYPLYYEIKDLIMEGSVGDFRQVLDIRRSIFPEQAQWVTFISNHDNYRSLSLFENNIDMWKQASLLQFILSGTPMIYYGDETGMTGKNPPDSLVRKKMNFAVKDKSFLSWYQFLINLRIQYSALSVSDSYLSPTTEVREIKKGVVRIVRNNELSIYLNLTNKPQKIVLTNNNYNVIEPEGIKPMESNINNKEIDIAPKGLKIIRSIK